MHSSNNDVFLLDKLLQAGYIMRDIKLLLCVDKGMTNNEIKNILKSPLFSLNVMQVISIAKALDKSVEYVVDAAQFGGKDMLQMNEVDFNVWMKRLSTEPLVSDVRRNLTWAIGRGFEVPKMIEEYLDNHPEKTFRKIRISPYQYKLMKDAEKNQIDKSSSTSDL